MNSDIPFALRGAKCKGRVAGRRSWAGCLGLWLGVLSVVPAVWAQGAVPWQSQDLGGALPAGSATESGGIVTLRAAGNDIWGTADQGHFRYQPLTENGEVIARVTSLENTDSWAKAGVMLRAGLEAGASNMALFVTPGGLICFQRRFAISGQTEVRTLAYVSLPVWLRLVWRGPIAIAHYSFDGVEWGDGVSWDIGHSMRQAGVAATSHRPGTLATATFDNVRVIVSRTAPPPPAPSELAVVDATSTSLALRWTDNASDETSFAVERSREGAGFVLVATMGENAESYTDTGLTPGTLYYYRVRAVRSSIVSGFSNTAQGTTETGPAVAEGWRNEDIGNVQRAGSATESRTEILSMRGAGDDVWGAADAFHFRYKLITGDSEIVAQVNTIDHTDGWAKAGVMMRAGLEADAPNVFVAFNPSFAATLQRRSTTGGQTTSDAIAWLWPGSTVRIVRRGDVFTAYANQQELGSVTIAMPDTIAVGTAVTSHRADELCLATFERARAYLAELPSPPPAPTGLTAAVVGDRAVELRCDYLPSPRTLFETYQSADGVYFYSTNHFSGPRVTVFNVAENHTSYFKMRAVEGTVRSEFSNIVSIYVPVASATPAAPTNLVLTTLSATQVRLDWTENATNETFVRVVRGRGGNVETAYTLPANTNTYTDSNLFPGQTYFYYIVVGNDQGGSAMSNTVTVTTPADSTPPATWEYRDIGTPAVAGSTTASGGTFVVSGAGEDIWDRRDQFQFYSRALTGDGDVIVRLNSLENTHAWAKAGLMIRAGNEADAQNVFLFVTPQASLGRQARYGTGATTTLEFLSAVSLPLWLKAERRGEYVHTYYSYNGTQWSHVSASMLASWPATLRVGLAVTSHSPGVRCQATFDQVVVDGGAASAPVLPAPTGLTASLTTTNTVRLQWTDNASTETGFQIERASDGDFVRVGSVGGDLQEFTDPDVAMGSTYRYRVRAERIPPSTYSDYSNVATITVGAGSPAAWTGTRVGAVGRTDTSWQDQGGGAFTITAAGKDIWDGGDGFVFVHRSLTGDGQITARVTGLQETHAWAKAGVMIRESLEPGSPHAFMGLTPQNGAVYHSRPSLYANTTLTAGPWWSEVPWWLRIVRAGTTIRAYASNNGTSWTLVATETLALPSTVLIGLAVTAHDVTQLNTATFTNVQVTTGAP